MKQPIVILFTVVFGIFGFISIYYAKTDTFLDTLRDFSIALLTVLIPFAIAVMTDLLSKQSVNVEFKTLDLHVILDCILKVKLFIFSIVVLFGLLTLMDIESKNIKFLSASELIADAIIRIHERRPVSPLFNATIHLDKK